MKLNKIEFGNMFQQLMDQCGSFANAQTFERLANAYFEKLKWQENEIVKKVMSDWDGSKMPNAIELLKKCKELSEKKSVSKILSPSEQICRYMDYGDVDECEVSRYMCANKSDNFPIDADRVNFCLNSRPDKKIICYWHQQVIMDQIEIERYLRKYGSIINYDVYFTKRTIKNMASFSRHALPSVSNPTDRSLDDELQGLNLDVSKMYREWPLKEDELSHLSG